MANDVRNMVKRAAQYLNKGTVRFAELLEDNFPEAKVYIDQVIEGEEGQDILIGIDEATGDLILGTDGDFFLIESGDFLPTVDNSGCYGIEQTTVTYVSSNSPDILEDNLTILAISKGLNFTLQSMTKTVQPVGNTSNQITMVVGVFTRAAKRV